MSVTFRSEPDALRRLLAPQVKLDVEPVARLDASYMTGIPWLAGRGYNTFGLSIPAVWEGQETIHGDFLTVLFENLADPIISGREELGWNKLWCELPSLERGETWAYCRAAWLGFQFAQVELADLREIGVQTAPGGRPKLVHKYVPRTGHWGTADVDEVIVSPASRGSSRAIGRWEGDASLRFTRARWEDLPTLVRIANVLAELPVNELVSGTLTHTVGSDDLYATRRAR